MRPAYSNLRDCFTSFAMTINKHVIASVGETPFEKTIIVPDGGEMQPYVYLCAGWNVLVEIAVSDGINLDKPQRARKVGNEM